MTDQIPICSHCGSINVMADAYVSWDHSQQMWRVQNVFDKGAYCNDCDGETSIAWEDY